MGKFTKIAGWLLVLDSAEFLSCQEISTSLISTEYPILREISPISQRNNGIIAAS
jgi:hypothetical protein